MKGFLQILGGLLGFVGLIAILIGWNAISRATADVSRDDVAVWLHTPHVGPGGTLDVELKVYGGKEIGIRRIEVTGGARPLEITGRGEYWGGVIRSSMGHIASDSIEFEIEVPPDARPGTDLELRFDVSYVKAMRRDAKTVGGTFGNEEGTAMVTITVPVLSPGGRVVAHLLSLGRGLLAFMLFTALYVWLSPKLRGGDGGPGPDDAFVIVVIAALGIAGYVLFAQPLMAALATSSTVLVVLAMIAWVVGPPLLAVMLARGRRWRRRSRGTLAPS